VTADEMTCRELVEVITDYLEGRLGREDRRRFDEHIADCPYCRSYLEQMRLTVASLGELPEESISPRARDDLLDAFRGWSGGVQRS
jgi:anti-sigma factor RsiW